MLLLQMMMMTMQLTSHARSQCLLLLLQMMMMQISCGPPCQSLCKIPTVLCESELTSCCSNSLLLLQTVVPGNPVDDFKLLVRTVGSLVRANALNAAAREQQKKELVA